MSYPRDEKFADDADAAEDDNLPEVDSIIFGELMHLPLPGKELRMAAMQVRAALHRRGHLADRAAVPSEQEPVAYRWRPAGVTFGDVWSVGVTPPREKSGWTVEPLYVHPAPAAGVKVKPPKWKYFALDTGEPK